MELDKLNYFKLSEDIVKIMMAKTHSTNPVFFRVLVSYYLAKVASMMRCNIKTNDRGNIPVSMYGINLSPSGTNKGFSTNIIEESVIKEFTEEFLESTFPTIADENLNKMANKRAFNNNTEPDEELAIITKNFIDAGEMVFSFDSGTTPAVKQLRYKLLMANAGSVNLEIDEIGSNLLNNTEVLNTFLELFDVGKVKQKLTKNTNENTRGKEIQGRTPTNMMLFGTPNKLMDGGKIESEFFSMLETGYARRCVFGYTNNKSLKKKLTAEERYSMSIDATNTQTLMNISKKLKNLANIINFNKTISLPKNINLKLIEYQIYCEDLADSLSEHEEILKAELTHRYFKALKLAGAYAFISESREITEDLLGNAIKLVEDSGIAFRLLLNRDRNYIRLAKYIADIKREVTHVDLVEDLNFYKGSVTQKADMMNLAIAYGHKNHIVIKKSYVDGIEFFKGESLKETNLDEIIISYSTDIVKGYTNQRVPFNQLHKLIQLEEYHFVNHHLKDKT